MLLFLVNAFVQTFGITQPTPAGARKAARVLGWALLALLPVLVWVMHAAYVLVRSRGA